MNGRRVGAGAALAVVLAMIGLAGCSGGGSDSAAGGSSEMAAVAPQPAPPDAGTGSGSDSAARQDSAGSTSQLKLEPALIRTAQLSVIVDDVPAKAGEATALARAAGGAVAGDERSGADERARATLVLKVPPARMDTLLDQVGGLGDERSRTSTTQDVTDDVADIGSRVATMQASIARVRAILSRADKIGDVVSVEGELSRRVTELEALQARQRALAGQTGYATVTVQLSADRAAAVVPVEEDRSGFLGGLQNGWDAFTATVGWLLLVIGALLPFLLVAVPVALAVRWALRRSRSAPAAPVAPGPAAPAA